MIDLYSRAPANGCKVSVILGELQQKHIHLSVRLISVAYRRHPGRRMRIRPRVVKKMIVR